MADNSTIFERKMVEEYARAMRAVKVSENIYKNSTSTFEWTGDIGKGTGCTHDMIERSNETGEILNVYEIKDNTNGARSGEMDLRYTEEGKLIPTPRGKKNYAMFAPYIDAFNRENNYFHLTGNFALTEDHCAKIVDQYYASVDYLLTKIDGQIIRIPGNKVSQHASYKGSEIRRLGKNPVRVFTPKHLHDTMTHSPHFIKEDDNFYYCNQDILISRFGRNGSQSSKYNLPSTYEIAIDNIEFIENNVCKISKNGIKQKNANISIHTKIITPLETLKKAGYVINE